MVELHNHDGPSFPRMLGIFFAMFHPTAGPSVIYQVPSNLIGSAANGASEQTYSINMDTISEYVIPRRQLCGRIVGICNSGYRVLGYPVYMEGAHYERNALIFNCCVVFDEADDVATYKPVVCQLAKVLKSMEELRRSLSTESARNIVLHVIEQVLEDLNNYCECMIPIVDEEVTLNIKLFPQYAQPLKVQRWHVPVTTVRLRNLVDANWDLTLQKIIPYIDGVISVSRIAELADINLKLVIKCIEHLCYYNCALVIDIFQFGGVYAPTPSLNDLNLDSVAQEECCNYIAVKDCPVSPYIAVFALYASLRQGLFLKDWFKLHVTQMKNIDLRRFITFGVIKGFLYRVYAYPYLPIEHRRNKTMSLADGTRHFDEICSMLARAPGDVLAEYKASDQLQIIYR